MQKNLKVVAVEGVPGLWDIVRDETSVGYIAADNGIRFFHVSIDGGFDSYKSRVTITSLDDAIEIAARNL